MCIFEKNTCFVELCCLCLLAGLLWKAAFFWAVYSSILAESEVLMSACVTATLLFSCIFGALVLEGVLGSLVHTVSVVAVCCVCCLSVATPSPFHLITFSGFYVHQDYVFRSDISLLY